MPARRRRNAPKVAVTPEEMAENMRKTLQVALLSALEERGLNKKELAASLSISNSRASQLLGGQDNMTIETMCWISWALDIELRLQAIPIAA